MTYERLSLRAQYMMLARDPDRPKRITSDLYFNYGMAAACMLELGQGGFLESDEKGRLKPQRLIHCTEPSLKRILEILNKRRKPYTAKQTIQRVVQLISPAIRDTRKELLDAGVFTKEDKRFLGLIPYRRYHLRKAEWRDALIRDLQDVLRKNGDTSGNLQNLLILTHISKMHRAMAQSKKQVKTVETDLKAYLKGNEMQEAMSQAIKEMQVAMIFTGFVVATTVTTSR